MSTSSFILLVQDMSCQVNWRYQLGMWIKVDVIFFKNETLFSGACVMCAIHGNCLSNTRPENFLFAKMVVKGVAREGGHALMILLMSVQIPHCKYRTYCHLRNKGIVSWRGSFSGSDAYHLRALKHAWFL